MCLAVRSWHRRVIAPMILLSLMATVMLIFAASAGAGAVVSDGSFGDVIVAEERFDAVTVDAIAQGPSGTVYVGGRWRPVAGGPDFVGVMHLDGDGGYLGRLGDWTAAPQWVTSKMTLVSGVAFDDLLNCVWVSGAWDGGEGRFSGAACYALDGTPLRRVAGLSPLAFPTRYAHDVAVNGLTSTVYVAGMWIGPNGWPAIRSGVAGVDPADSLACWLGSLDTWSTVEGDEEGRAWNMREAVGVAWAPNDTVYAAGTWQDGGLVSWVGALEFTPAGVWSNDIACAIPEGGLDTAVVFDVDADQHSNALVAAIWGPSGGRVASVGRFTESGGYVDCFGEVIEHDGAEYRATAITAVASGRNLPPEFTPVAPLSAVERRPLEVSVSAQDVFRYHVTGSWSAPARPAFTGVAAFTERGVPGDLTYSVEQLPDGAVFDPATRTLEWTPSPEDVGEWTIVFVASDGELETRMPLPITVSANTAPGPAGDPLMVQALEETPADVVLTATDAEGDPLTYEIMSGPSNGSLAGEAPRLTYTGSTDFFGTDSFVYRASDGYDWSGPIEATILVENVDDPPVVTPDLATVATVEGQVARMGGTWSDPDSESVAIVSAPVGGVAVREDGTWTWEWLATDGPEATADVAIRYWDECGEDVFECGFRVDVAPAPPVLEGLTCPVDPVPVGATVEVTGAFTDPGMVCPHSGTADWGDGTTGTLSISESGGRGTFSASHVYSLPGIYGVSVTCSDDDGQGSTSPVGWVVVYDPNGGFVTGGGWIESPPSAYTPDDASDADVTGRAHFAFEAAYRKGANAPDGRTSFRFQAAGLSFTSDAYQWLVVSGSKAQFKGTGTVDGSSGFGFMLTATDGGARYADRFRMRIWDLSTGVSVYDNQVGSTDTAAPACAIGGGSIIVRNN